MKTRPLCFVCLLFILLQGVLLIIQGGESLTEIPAASVFCENKDKTVLIKGEVYKKANTSNNQILYLKNNSVGDDKLLIYDSKFSNIPIGKQILIRGELKPFEEARNPGAYNEALYYARQNIYGAVWCREILQISGEENPFLEWLHQIKEMWKTKFTECMGEKNGGILSAMVLGDKSVMDADVRELYQKNGISHILAISGLHISFIGLGIYQLLRKTGLPFWCAGVASMGILTIYTLMIGFSVSVFRAYLMLALRLGADITGRVYDMATATLLGAALTVAYQPLYLTDGGFYMSYGAIIGILVLLPVLEKCFPYKMKFLSGCYASLAINLMLFPITLWFFYVFSTYSTFINIFVLPLTGPILGMGILGGLLVLFFPAAGELCLNICSLILSFFEWICNCGNKLPMSQAALGRPDIWKLVLYYIVLFGIIIFVGRAKKYFRVVWISLPLVIALFGYRPSGFLDITMLDVGQGDCIYICGPEGVTYLIDGGSSDKSSLGKYCIEPFLKSQGTGELDYVFVSHGDTDHYSGIEEMICRQGMGIKIRNLVLPVNYRSDKALVKLAKEAGANGVNVSIIKEGEVLQEGNLAVRCLQPAADDSNSNGNAGSMVLEIIYQNFSMLCTGDVEAEGEAKLRTKVKGKGYDILKVAHHGSENSTSMELLKIISPRIALISAGKNNRYGHPHEELLQRLRENRCIIYQTKENGAIMLRTDGNSLTIR